jgi:uncharacterized metal-binding protein YceD (DUF177 family)
LRPLTEFFVRALFFVLRWGLKILKEFREKMNTLKEFLIPVKGLKNGAHEFHYELGASFFKLFEDSPIEIGEFDVWVDLVKSEGIYEFSFDFEGSVGVDCDRCLAGIRMPISDVQDLRVKVSLEKREEEADIVYVTEEDHEINIAQYLHEFICLALPLNNVYDCENDANPPCDREVLKKIGADALPPVSDESNDNPFNDLKDLINEN